MHKHARSVAAMGRDQLTSYLVRDYFGLPRGRTMMASLLSAGLGQADLVLCLLRLRDRASPDHGRLLSYYVRRLVGRPIQRGAPCVLHYYVNGHAPRVVRPAPTAEDRRVVWVASANPRQPNTSAAARWASFRIGRTVAQLRARGVTKRDIRRAERRGWVRFEEVRA